MRKKSWNLFNDPRISPSNICYVLSVSTSYIKTVSFLLRSSCFFFFIFGHSPSCWKTFLSLFCYVLFCLYFCTLSRNLLSLPSFDNIFWFISSSCVVRFVCSCRFGVFSLRWPSVRITFLSSFVVVSVSLFDFLASFLVQVLNFCSDSFGGYLFYC